MNSPAAKRNYKQRAITPLRERLERSIMPLAECGCWIWMNHLDETGYGTFRCGHITFRAHRVSWMEFRGTIPPGKRVLHTCDIRCCVNPDHLFLGTQKDNMDDMRRKGRAASFVGEKNPRAKITAAQAAEIRQSDMPTAQLCELYGLKKSMIRNIKLGNNWNE
jgi:hypothetical protein